jgi:nucleoside-diphosphate-sugar epimerase
MDVLIAGGHGKVARRLIRLLARDGHTARGLIRNPDHAADIEADGGTAVVCDLERDDVGPHIGAADAIVFAAGAGPGSGPERKRTVDLEAAVKCVEAAERQGVGRFVIVSSIGAEDPDGGPEQMRPYLQAKAAADARVVASGLDWTIVRPGSLQDGPGTGLVDVSTTLGRRGGVARDDVALVLAETLQAPGTTGLTFELFAGGTPAREAVRALGAER